VPLIEVVKSPDGSEFAVEGRPSGPRRGGSDAASLLLDAASALYSRVVKNGAWQVEIRPWPTGRKPKWREVVDSKAAAEKRLAELIQLVEAGGWPA
jgi:hypothetical protein